MNNNNFDIARFGISIDEARKQLGIGRNLMLKLVTVPGFPAIRFKRKIIINGAKLQEWLYLWKILRFHHCFYKRVYYIIDTVL